MLAPFVEQIDFSGGTNLIDDPADLGEKEVSDSQNVRIINKSTIEQRLGYTQFNSSAIAAAAVTSLYQFKDYQNNLIPIAQCNGTVSKGSAAFPATGSFSSILTETAGYGLGVMDSMWGRLVYVNNKDVPKTYEGTYSKCYGLYKTTDNESNYIDYTTEVVDEDSATYAQIGALSTVANGDWIIVKARVPKIKGIRLVIDGTYKNTGDSTAVVEYRSATGTWTAVSALSDGTNTTVSFEKTGDMAFTECTCVPDLVGGLWGYWLRISTDVALSADVRVLAVYIMYDTQTLPNFWEGSFIKPDGCKTSSDTSVTFKDYSAYVRDNSLSTAANLGGLTVTTGALYVQSAKKFRGMRVTMDTTNVNTNAVTLTANYWTGTAWASLTIVDGTSANSKTLAQSGLITWSWTTGTKTKKLAVDDIPLYQVQFLFGAALSAAVDIAEIELIEETEDLKPHKLCIFHRNRLFLINRADALNYLFYSAAFKPDVHTGSDSGYIGIPSGKPITAVCRFFNELFVATADEIYLLQGYSPQTFGLLKINSGGIGCVSHHSVVSVGKFIYFAHSTGFYRFDGVGVVLISRLIGHFFDPAQSAYFIPVTRLEYIQGRFDRTHDCVEWSVSKGSAQTTNNCFCIFNINGEGWWFDNVVAASMLRTTGVSYQDLLYHGDYAGRVHQDWSGTTDNTVAISAHAVTKGFGRKDVLSCFRVVGTKLKVQSAGGVTVTYALGGSSTFTSLGTLSNLRSGYSYSWQDIADPLWAQTVRYKFAQATSGETFSMTGVRVGIQSVRAEFPQT